jgi:hypothetical protein
MVLSMPTIVRILISRYFTTITNSYVLIYSNNNSNIEPSTDQFDYKAEILIDFSTNL